jgi:hypothetical protein
MLNSLSCFSPARVGLAALLAACGTVCAQPVLEIHSLIDADLSSSGTKAVGFVYDAQIEAYRVFVWERGVGYTAIPNAPYSAEPVRGSDDLSVLATGASNTANWGDLNCFNGYCTNFNVDCTPGDPLPPPSPCFIPSIAHRYTTAGGWQNLGSVARTLSPGVNRFFGGTRCDSSINTSNDISGNGRYVVGGAWSTGLFTESGNISSGQCGNLVAYISDSATGTVSTLAVGPDNAGDSRADFINSDGTVITGYDFGPVESEFGTFNSRRIVVWTNGVQTMLDDLSGFGDGFPVNEAGTHIAGAPSNAFCLANFGVDAQRLVKWTRQPDNSWTPTNLGTLPDFFDGVETKPLLGIGVRAISNDGNTIVGSASYGTSFFDRISRAFIWRAGVNGGAPMDLGAYIASIAPGSPIIAPGITIQQALDISADGNAIGVQLEDARTTCPPETFGLATGLSGVLYLNGTPSCSPPQIGLPPRDNTSVQYTPFGVALNVTASGTWPLNFLWQREDPQNAGQWLNLTDACAGFVYGSEWDNEGTDKNQLRIGQANCGNNRDGSYRVVVSNACGSLESSAAEVTFTQGTIINQQPTPASTCPGQSAFVFAVAVSNSADIPTQWQLALASDPDAFIDLQNGANILPDGREAEVFGADGQFCGINPAGNATATGSEYIVRAVFNSPCGSATSDTTTLSVSGGCPLVCDSIDFNGDGLFPDDNDLITFLSVLAGGECPPEFFCNDIDFNNDGLFPDDNDLVAFLRVLAGGGCEE